MSTDLSRMNATDTATGYRARQFSPVEVAKALLQTIERRESELNAMWLVKVDAALSSALASERRWREGRPLSPLDGVPITIKDNIATVDDPTPMGIAGNLASVAAEDAPCSCTPEGGRARDPGQDDHAGLRHAGRRNFEPARCHQKPMAYDLQHGRLELRRRRSSCRGLCATGARHRHRRLDQSSCRSLRGRRSQAELRTGADRCALFRSDNRSHGAKRAGRRSAAGHHLAAR